MASYLGAGWYESSENRSLRADIIDGAMDVAGMLIRDGVTPSRVHRVALKVRSLVHVSHPAMQCSTQ